VTAPVLLTLIGRPRPDWAPRVWPVGLSLLVALGLLAFGITRAVRDEVQHTQQSFDAEVEKLQTAFNLALKEPVQAAQSVAAYYRLDAVEASAAGHRQITQPWMNKTAGVAAVAWAQPQPVVGSPASTSLSATPAADLPLALRFVDTSAALDTTAWRWQPGLTLSSLAGAQDALNLAVKTGQAVAWLIPQSTLWLHAAAAPQGDSAPMVSVLMQPVFNGEPLTPAERAQSLRGVVLVGFQLERELSALRQRVAPALSVCLQAPAHPAERQSSGGANHCAAAVPGQMEAAVPLSGWLHPLQLRVWVEPADLRQNHHLGARTLAVIGLLAVAMLGALLLTVTGRARRVQVAVADRTSELLQQIKEREATQAQLRESETRLTNIVNNLPLGVIYCNLQGQIKQVNTRFCNLLGYSADELIQMSEQDYTHPDDAALDDHWLAQLVSEHIPVFSQRKRLIRKDGSLLWVQSTVSLLRDAQGQPRRTVAAVEDITEHLRLADAERAREAAETSNQAKSMFLSRMSHELRTPLNAMLGFAQLLELDNRQPLPDAQRGWVAQIQKAGWHLLDMINDVMDLSRIESGNLRLQETTLDLFELLAGTLPLVEADAKRRAVTITHDVAPDAGWVRGDATRVKQILTNLLSNAVKYNVEGGRIHVASRARQGMVELSVTDTGLGLSDEQMKALFQPFNRLGRDRSSIEGTGIGLVISQRLAEWMGGSLRAQSAAGQGSSFTLVLPQVERRDSVHSELDEPVATLSTYHRRRVHYVEDNETNVEVMRGILAQRPQIELTVSLNGLDGLAAIRTLRPDVILLDMHLPDINGMELLRHLRSEGNTAGIPVVMVSADALQTQVEEALRLGASHYLTKPVNVSDLLSILDDILMGADTVFGEGIT
jgi:PAS domain S-box-containing protein